MVGVGGGVGRHHLGGGGEEGLGSISFPKPHPPNRPLPQPQHLVHAGRVPDEQVPSNGQGLEGGSGVQVGGVGLVVAVLGVGGPQVKKGPLQPVPPDPPPPPADGGFGLWLAFLAPSLPAKGGDFRDNSPRALVSVALVTILFQVVLCTLGEAAV